MTDEVEARAPSIWQIDANDVIESVGGSWDSFATENGASWLAGTSVVGRSLFEFITGDENRHIHRHLLRSVRAQRSPLSVPFRCDSPDLRRHMRLELRPAEADAVEFRAVLLRAEQGAHLRLLDPAERRGRSMVVSCSFCHRIRDERGEWLEVDTATERMELLNSERPPVLIHGVCLACKTRLLRRLEDRSGGGEDGGTAL